MSKNTDNLADKAIEAANELSERAAREADQTLAVTRRAAADASHSLREGLEALREEVPTAFSRAAAQAEALSRQGLERARQAGDQTVDYIRDEPVKAVAMAAAVGAVAALLVGWLGRSSRSGHASAR